MHLKCVSYMLGKIKCVNDVLREIKMLQFYNLFYNSFLNCVLKAKDTFWEDIDMKYLQTPLLPPPCAGMQILSSPLNFG